MNISVILAHPDPGMNGRKEDCRPGFGLDRRQGLCLDPRPALPPIRIQTKLMFKTIGLMCSVLLTLALRAETIQAR